MAVKRVVVTGGSGKAGRAVVRDLLEHGYDILNVDLAPPAERRCPFIKADLTRPGEVFETLRGFDAVVHLAAIPAPASRRQAITSWLSTYPSRPMNRNAVPSIPTNS